MKRRDSFPVLLAGISSPALLRAAASKIEAMETAVQLIQKQVDAGVLESAVLRVQRGDEVSQRVFGKTSEDSMFLLGSITKTMTAAAVMVLADRGALRLTDRAVKYLPEFAEGARAQITIQHLLTHTSGLPDQLENNSELRRRHATMGEFIQGALRTPLLFAPGEKYHYQSMGILLAADVVQRITGKPLKEFLAREVFAPLAMKRSALGLDDFKLADTVRCQMEHAAPEAGGGAPEARDWDWNSPWWRAFGAPWGGAHSTAADVTLFLRSFLHPDGRILREPTARLMIQDLTPGLSAHRGLGFAVGPHGLGRGCSEKAFGHTGSTGMIAWADPKTDTTCVLLTSLPLQFSGDLFVHAAADAISTSA